MAFLPVTDYDLDSVPEGVIDPLTTITAEQRAKIEHLRAVSDTWNLAPPEQEFVDDMCLYRFLLGLNWDEKAAEAQLKEACEWRASYKPQDIRIKDVEPLFKQGYCFSIGRDKMNRPIIYLLLGKDKIPNDEEGKELKIKFIVYIMEMVIRAMPRGIYSITWVIDVQGASLSMSLIKQVKDMFTKIGDYYTERLAMAFACNMPWTISLLWNFVKPFLAKETVAKYRFVKGSPKQLCEIMSSVIEPDQLITDFGGSVEVDFDFEKMVEAEEFWLKKHAERKRRNSLPSQ